MWRDSLIESKPPAPHAPSDRARRSRPARRRLTFRRERSRVTRNCLARAATVLSVTLTGVSCLLAVGTMPLLTRLPVTAKGELPTIPVDERAAEVRAIKVT